MDSERMRRLAERAGLRGVQPRVVMTLAFVCAVLAGIALWRAYAGAGQAFEVKAGESAAGESANEASVDASASVVVHVTGAVVRPGVVELPLGSRVLDAVEACGGLLGSAEPGAVNLARTLTDSEQILVPTQEDIAKAADVSAGQARTSDGLVDLNRASAEQLQELPGIGPSTAAKIVTDREQNGPFARPEDLQRVAGIGPKKYESLKDLVAVP